MAGSKELNLDGFVGVALIVSNDYAGTKMKLTGTHKDSKKMEKVFKQFRYRVIKIINVSKKDLKSYLTFLSEYNYPPTCRRIVITFAGHGSDGILLCQDKKELKIKDMVSQFKPGIDKPTLGKTVRMFFIDACRGSCIDGGYTARGNDAGVEDDTEVDVTNTLAHIPIEGNTFVGYSSTRLHKAFETSSGGLWTSCFAEKLETEDASLNDIFVDANAEMSKVTIKGGFFQTASCSHDLKEKVFFKRESQGIYFSVFWKSCVIPSK